MSFTTIMENWSELKDKIKSKWGKLSDHELEALKDDFVQLSGRIQQVYGYSKEQAEKEFAELHEMFRTHSGK